MKCSAFRVFIAFWSHHHFLILGHVQCSQKTLIVVTPYSPLLQTPSSSSTLETINLLSISMDFPILNVLHKWNHTVYVFLCLTSFNVFKVHPCCTICYFVLFNQTPFSNYLALVYVSGHKLNCEHPESQSQKRKAQIYYSALVSYKGSTKFITYTVFSLLSYFHDGQLPLGQTFWAMLSRARGMPCAASDASSPSMHKDCFGEVALFGVPCTC
jgi:hypothetical protein